MIKYTKPKIKKGDKKVEVNFEILRTNQLIQQELNSISDSEREQIDNIKKDIDIQDSMKVLSFGTVVQRDIATFTDNILSNIKSKDSGEIRTLLSQLILKTKEIKPHNNILSYIPIIKNYVNTTSQIIDCYDKVSTQITAIQIELERHRMIMLKDIAMFDDLFRQNVIHFKHLNAYIIAGKEKVQEIRESILPALRQTANDTGDKMALQIVSDFEQNLERFEKKLYDLQLSKTIALQTAPQIRLIQNANKILCEKITFTIYTTLPAWRNQMIIALGLRHQSNVLRMQKAINDTTNKMLQQNSMLLKENVISIQKEANQTTVDIAAIKKANENIIATINEVLRIQKEAKSIRETSERELAIIENNLKHALLNISK